MNPLLLILLTCLLGTNALSASPKDSVDALTQHYRGLWTKVMTLACEGHINAYSYYDRSRISPDDLMCEVPSYGFIAIFSSEVSGPVSTTRIQWLGTKAYSIYGGAIELYFHYEDLYAVLSATEIASLEHLAFLLKNTTIYGNKRYYALNWHEAIKQNMKGEELAHYFMQNYSLLYGYITDQVSKTLRDSSTRLSTYTDRTLSDRIELWKAFDKAVIQIADQNYPGEFIDSVAIRAYGIERPGLSIDGDLLSIHCSTGETVYCHTEEFMDAVPAWCAALLRIIHGV